MLSQSSNMKIPDFTKTRLLNKKQFETLQVLAKGKYVSEITKEFNNIFNTNLTERQIRNQMKRYSIYSGIDTRFKKGQSPFNIGKKYPGRGQNCSTCFKKGHVPYNRKNVGDLRTLKGNVLYIKIAQPNKWQSYHSYLWEKYHKQKVPKEKIVIFIDGNERNFNIDNLALVTRKELILMNNLRIEKGTTKLLIGKIRAKICDRKKELK